MLLPDGFTSQHGKVCCFDIYEDTFGAELKTVANSWITGQQEALTMTSDERAKSNANEELLMAAERDDLEDARKALKRGADPAHKLIGEAPAFRNNLERCLWRAKHSKSFGEA